MSLRFDRIDNFWFVLRHEIEDVLQMHGRAAAMLDAELEGDRAGTGPQVNDEERIANEAAQEFCVPSSSLDAFVARKEPFFSERDLIGFARIIKTHPGILVGKLNVRPADMIVSEIISPKCVRLSPQTQSKMAGATFSGRDMKRLRQ